MVRTDDGGVRHATRLPPPVALGLLLALAAALTWRAWGDVATNGALDLYVAARVAAGHPLYTAVPYDQGPLAPAVLAGVFRALGTGLGQALGLGLALALAAVCATYGVARELVARPAATACAAVAATGVVLAPGAYDFALPAEWSRSAGAVVALAGVLAALRALDGGPAWWAGAGALLGLESVTRPLWLLVLGTPLAVACVLADFDRTALLRRLAACAAAAAGVAALGYLALPATGVTALARSADLARPGAGGRESVGRLLLHAAVYLAIAAALALAGRMLRARRGVAIALALAAVAAAAVLMKPVAGAKALHASYDWLALLAIAVAALAGGALARGQAGPRTARRLALALAVVAAAAVDRLDYAPGRPGAFLLPLGLVLLADLHANLLGGRDPRAARAGVAWLALVAAGSLVAVAHDARARTVSVSSPRGTLRALPADGWALRPALEALGTLGPKPRVYAAGDAATLLFLADARPLEGWDGIRPLEPQRLAGLARRSPPAAALFTSRGGADAAGRRVLLPTLPNAFTYTGAVPQRLEITMLVPGRAPARTNAIVRENAKTGGLSSTGWRLHDISTAVEGYTTQTSVDTGSPIELRVASRPASYRIDVWRAGWYGAPGVMRLYATLRRQAGATGARANAERGCGHPDARTGYLRCAWRTTDTIPTRGWPSGIYLVNLSGGGGMSQTVVVVRDDASRSDILYQASTTTWQAYNPYGGKSLYTFNSSGRETVARTTRAVQVSFDRPYANPRTGGYNWFLRAELPMVTWLERNGYDVSYSDDIATARLPRLLLRHRVFLASGHDEYWSQSMRDAVTRARNRGVSIAIFSSNTSFWRIRLAAGGRTEVCYKTDETPGAARDPVSPTVLWRDPRGPNEPENSLLGAMYVGDEDTDYFPITVRRSADPLLRNVFRKGGSTLRLGTNLVGWEWDSIVHNGRTPPGVRVLAASPVHGEILSVGETNHYADGPAVATSTIYRAASGALVFDAATNQWAWGLEPDGYVHATQFERWASRLRVRGVLDRLGITSAAYTGRPNAGTEIPELAQLTYNVLAAMGARPALPRASPLLVESAP